MTGIEQIRARNQQRSEWERDMAERFPGGTSWQMVQMTKDIDALLDVASAAQAWGRFACNKIPEKVALTSRQWAEAECGECPSCRSDGRSSGRSRRSGQLTRRQLHPRPQPSSVVRRQSPSHPVLLVGA